LELLALQKDLSLEDVKGIMNIFLSLAARGPRAQQLNENSCLMSLLIWLLQMPMKSHLIYHFAAQCSVSCVELLLSVGCPNIRNLTGKMPCDLALKAGRFDSAILWKAFH